MGPLSGRSYRPVWKRLKTPRHTRYGNSNNCGTDVCERERRDERDARGSRSLLANQGVPPRQAWSKRQAQFYTSLSSVSTSSHTVRGTPVRYSLVHRKHTVRYTHANDNALLPWAWRPRGSERSASRFEIAARSQIPYVVCCFRHRPDSISPHGARVPGRRTSLPRCDYGVRECSAET
jgi:hypothetical protein